MKKLFPRLNARSIFVETQGAVSIVVALVLVLLLIMIGGVLDFGAALVARTQSQAATDATAMAIMQPPGGGTPAVEGQVAGKRYFDVNYPRATGGMARAYTDLGVVIQPDKVTVSSDGAMPSKLLQLGGIDAVPVDAVSVVGVPMNTTPPDFDLVLVTDSSRSMACGANEDTDPTPFGDPALGSGPCALLISNPNLVPTGPAGSRHMEMVAAAHNLVDTIMATPSQTIRFGLVEFSSNIKEKKPLTSDKTQAEGYINAITLDTWTCGACGMDGAIQLLSNSPMPVTNRPDGNALSPVKFLIFMSDGVQTCAAPGDPPHSLDALIGGNCGDDAYDTVPPSYTPAGLPHAEAITRPFDDLEVRCAQLKSMGVNITTIAFGVDVQVPGRNQDALRNCASMKPDGSAPQFYLAPDYSALNNAMQGVAKAAGRMRITK